MTRTHRTHITAGLVGVIVAATIALTGCTTGAQVAAADHKGAAATPTEQQGGHAARAKSYLSTKALADDSGLVVTGRVTSQRTVNDISETTDFTLSTLEVLATPKSKGTVKTGARITVRQLGSAEQFAPAPLLTEGTEYLLYLVPSALPGALASQYYVTGGDAGLYQENGSASRASGGEGATFSKVPVADETLDRLPQRLTLAGSIG